MKQKSCGCVIIKKGKVLLVYEHRWEYWGFPKGHVEEGETEEETAIREVKEEVGLKPHIYKDYRYTAHYPIENNTIDKEVVFFLASVDEDILVNQEGEIDMSGWFTEKEAEKILKYDYCKEILYKAFEDSRKL